jgi:hypothetical protein
MQFTKSIKQILFFYISISFIGVTSLVAYSDSDLDGVDDAVDKCPNTPMFDLVDATGCTKKRLKVQTFNTVSHYDFITGLSYSKADYRSLNQSDTTSLSLQFDYYYKKFSLGISTFYFNTKSQTYNSSGLYDTYVSGTYTLEPLTHLTLYLGGGVILPTYSTTYGNNNTDYSASLSFNYMYKKFNYFAGVFYTLIGDDDIVDNNETTTDIYYQNTNGLNLGVGYYFNDSMYGSVSYNMSKSIYADVENLDSLMFYGYYTINKNYFSTFSYTYGISDSASDYTLSIRIGYYY